MYREQYGDCAYICLVVKGEKELTIFLLQEKDQICSDTLVIYNSHD